MALNLREEIVENGICQRLEELDYEPYSEPFNSNDLQEVLDYERLRERMLIINNNLDERFIDEAIKKIKKFSDSSIVDGNNKCLEWIKNGIPVKVSGLNEDKSKNVKLVDFKIESNNEFKFARQLKIVSKNYETIIPDVLVYLNGLPISMIELKSPEAVERLEDAYKQLNNYQNRKYSLGFWNIFGVVSNGFITKYGSLFASFNSHWWSWKQESIDSRIIQDIDYRLNPDEAIYNYRKNIIGLFEKSTLLNIIKSYVFYANSNNKLIKYIPAYHQYWAVQKAIRSLKNAKNGMGGVIWHTQGSGKSVTMVFLAKKIKENFGNYKIVYVTDRKELDDQLSVRLKEARDYLVTDTTQIESRNELREVLSDDMNFGIYTTTIQKFTEETDVLSTKSNVIIIADEAHRSHNNIETEFELNLKNREIVEKEGYAKYIRDSFPNATFIGFTGTPLLGEKKTTDVFGDYIDQYPLEQAVRDNATIPIHYEKRKMIIELDPEKAKELDKFYAELYKDKEAEFFNKSKDEFIKKNIGTLKNFFSNPTVISKVVKDFWEHYDIRAKALNGKAMFVAFDRNIAFLIYKEMIKQRPEFEDKIKLVMTGSNKDDQELSKLIPSNEQKKEIATEFKKDDSKIKIAVVVDMWLTGFDVPDLDTLYLFKVIKWHNLMQTLARVNRTYSKKDKVKKDGLIVDYVGIWKYISEALEQYGGKNFDKVKYDIEEVKYALLKRIDELRKQYFYKDNLLSKWTNSNSTELDKFESLEDGSDLVLSLNKHEQDLFFGKVSKINRYYKLSRQILTKLEILESQYFILIKNLLRSKRVDDNSTLRLMLEEIKKKMDSIIITGDIETSSVSINGRKDLAFISELLKSEVDKYKNGDTDKLNLRAKILEDEMKGSIKHLRTQNPIAAETLSKRLQKILDKYSSDKNFEELLKALNELAKEMVKENEIGLEIEDPNLIAFYRVLASDKYLNNRNLIESGILKEILGKIEKIIKDQITSQWLSNPKLKNQVKLKIKLMLKDDYSFPPENQEETSKILIDKLTDEIKINKDYWIKEEL